MEDTHALQLLELLGEYARDHGADVAPDMTVRELAGDILNSLPPRYAGPSVDKARDSLQEVFGLYHR